jgi:hypothetical protein
MNMLDIEESRELMVSNLPLLHIGSKLENHAPTAPP